FLPCLASGDRGCLLSFPTRRSSDLGSVTDNDDLMIINKSGLTIRIRVSDLRVMGRNTQGVRLINIKGNDAIAAVAKVMREEDEEIEIDPSILVSEEEQLKELETMEPLEDEIEEIDDEIIEEDEDQEDQE